MGYYSWRRRPPRKYQGQPQWTVNDLYISPFTAKRLYNEDGDIHYEPIARNLNPTGIKVMDHYLRRLTEGKDVLRDFCPIYGLRTEDMDSLIYILTGMKGEDFRTAYQLRMADDLSATPTCPSRTLPAARDSVRTPTSASSSAAIMRSRPHSDA